MGGYMGGWVDGHFEICKLKPPNTITGGNLQLAIWDTSFWTFLSNLDTVDLETYPKTYSGQFCHMSLFDESRAI